MLYTLNTVLHCKLCEMEAVSMRVRATLVIYSLTGLFLVHGTGQTPSDGGIGDIKCCTSYQGTAATAMGT